MSFREVLETPEVREVHYQAKREYLPIMAEHGAYQADLCFLDAYKHQNRGYTGFLSIICMPNRFGYAVPIKSKDDTLRAFKMFLEEAHYNNQDVKRLETDGGSEFVNQNFRALLNQHGIEHKVARPGDHRKQGMVERFNESLRNWIDQYLTEKKVNNWVDTMPEILDYYNNRKHRTLGVAPASMTKEDEDDLRTQMYAATDEVRGQIDSIQPGDRVRVLMHKTAFAKGRLRWSDNVYTIESRLPNGYMFKLRETEVPQKYSDIQLVGPESRDIKPKAAATVALAERRGHALRLGRSGLARGPREAEELIDQVAAREAAEPPAAVPPQGVTPVAAGTAAARRPSTRERRLPAHLNDYVVGRG